MLTTIYRMEKKLTGDSYYFTFGPRCKNFLNTFFGVIFHNVLEFDFFFFYLCKEILINVNLRYKLIIFKWIKIFYKTLNKFFYWFINFRNLKARALLLIIYPNPFRQNRLFLNIFLVLQEEQYKRKAHLNLQYSRSYVSLKTNH